MTGGAFMNGTSNIKILCKDAYQDGSIVISGKNALNNAKLFVFHGKKYAINPNAILTINCTAKCNCNCFFCYNKKTFIYDDEYVSSDSYEMERIIEFAKSGNVKVVTLTGGEPTLNTNKMLALIAKFKKAGFETIRMHTNGMRLCQSVVVGKECNPLWKWLELFGLNDLSLSIADYRKEKNRQIMGFDNISALSGFLPYINDCHMRVRLSCYLSECGIYAINEIMEYIDFAHKYGIKYVIFRIEPSHTFLEETYINQILSVLLEKGWIIDYSHQKSDSIIYSLISGTLHICISCVKEELDKDQKIRRLIYMPNRIVYTSWIDPSSFLFEDDAEKIVKKAVVQHESVTSHQTAFGMPAFLHQESGYKIDLHVHSSVSDGENSPLEVLSAAKEKGITTLVFTEHNAIHDSYLQLKQKASTIGIDIPLVGVEFSTVYCIGEHPILKFHLLVYGKRVEQFSFMNHIFNPNNPKNEYLTSLYKKLYEQRLVRKTLQDLYNVPDLEIPTRKKMLLRRTLVKEVSAQCGLSAEEVTKLYVPRMDERERYKEYLDIADVIALARENGCATIIAHPGWIRPFDESSNLYEDDVFRAIACLARLGLNGVEIVHRLNDYSMREKLFRLADSLQLVVTGGSDYHGKAKCIFGQNGSTEDALAKIMEIIE